MIDLSQATGFQWDQGNTGKNRLLHGVEDSEAEQVFLGRQLVILDDMGHSQSEARFNALGVTLRGRFLHVTFTMRNANAMIRVISARDMEPNEEIRYVQEGA